MRAGAARALQGADVSKNRERIPRRMRFEVLKRDAFTCRYCGAKAPTVRLDLDHVQPLTEGGATTAENLVVSCETCNGGKGGARLPTPKELEVQTGSELRKVRAIVKNRLSGFDAERALTLLERAAAKGVTTTWLRERALGATSWIAWCDQMAAAK